MIELWTDIIIAKGARSVKNTKVQNKVNYMPFVYKKYNIDSTRFMESNIYYTSRVEDYKKMFEKVEENIKNIKAIYDPISTDIDPGLPIYKRDSIRRSKTLKKKEKIKEVPDVKMIKD